MNERARAILDEARETLKRIAHIKVEYRAHRDDGFSSDWAKGMPPKAPPVCIEDVRREITKALAERPNGLSIAEVEAKLAELHEIRNEVHGRAIAAERKLWRSEIEKLSGELVQLRAKIANAATGSNEFFYIDAQGRKQDADLHGPILRAVDGPFIDEKIMAPIRQRHRQRWLDEQAARRERSRRHG